MPQMPLQKSILAATSSEKSILGLTSKKKRIFMKFPRSSRSPISKYCSPSAHCRHSPVSGVGFLGSKLVLPLNGKLTRVWRSCSTSRPSSDSSADRPSCSVSEGGRARQARRHGKHLDGARLNLNLKRVKPPLISGYHSGWGVGPLPG